MRVRFIRSFLILVSTIIAVGIAEAVCYLSGVLEDDPSSVEKRILLFHSPQQIFANHEDILLHAPNKNVRVVAIYYNRKQSTKEIDYSFAANNYGLVQDDDLVRHKPSLLVLGDSFAEGFGSEPWFRDFSKSLTPKSEYQLVNGGVLGTGFLQFWKLESHLANSGIDIRKLVVVFESDDIRRAVFNLPDKVLHCVNGVERCDGTEGWLHFSDDSELSQWTNKRRAIDEPGLKSQEQDRLRIWQKEERTFLGWLKHRTPVIQSLYSHYLADLDQEAEYKRSPYKESIAGSKNVIRAMVAKYGKNNLIFIHIPQKEEVSQGVNSLGVMTRQTIKETDATLYNGFARCGLRKSDFFVHDTHPNPTGYQKISACVLDATSKILQSGNRE